MRGGSVWLSCYSISSNKRFGILKKLAKFYTANSHVETSHFPVIAVAVILCSVFVIAGTASGSNQGPKTVEPSYPPKTLGVSATIQGQDPNAHEAESGRLSTTLPADNEDSADSLNPRMTGSTTVQATPLVPSPVPTPAPGSATSPAPPFTPTPIPMPVPEPPMPPTCLYNPGDKDNMPCDPPVCSCYANIRSCPLWWQRNPALCRVPNPQL